MPQSLNGQPVDVLLPIFNKMNPQAQCRLRKTTKRMDNFVKQYRFRINKRAGQSLVNLYVKIPGWENEPMLCYVIIGYLNWHKLDEWGGRFKSYPGRMFCYGRNKIKDVYSQFSAIYFNSIVFDFNDIGRFTKGTERQDRKNAFVTDHLIPLLRKWRLSCDFLGIDGAKNSWVPQILPLVTFSRCCLPNTTPFKVYNETVSEMLPIEHCQEIFINVVHHSEALDNMDLWISNFPHLESLRIECSAGPRHGHALDII